MAFVKPPSPSKRLSTDPPSVSCYYSMLEFFTDLKLVFDNRYRFDGPDHVVLQCVKKLELSFENMRPHQ